MRKNRIFAMAEKVHLNDTSKKRIKALLHSVETEEREGRNSDGIRFGTRAAVAAAIVVSLSVSAFAGVHFSGMSLKKEDGKVQIEATGFENTTVPHFAWNPGDGEISVRLSFDFMPEDMVEDGTASHKYGSDTDKTRAITFNGFDLTREDLDILLEDIATAESFNAGGREAYLLIGDSEISLYNKDIYVLFSDIGLVVHGRAAYGLSDDELKAVASGMSVSSTEDVIMALPISNEYSGNGDSTMPDVFYNDRWNKTRDELCHMGDTAVYDGYFDSWKITVEDVMIYDSVSILKDELIDDHIRSKIDGFVDEEGNFIPYIRTKINYDTKKFEESERVEKSLVAVIVTLEGVEDEETAKTNLHGFDLYGLKEIDGKISPEIEAGEYAIDSTPGTVAHYHETVYKEYLGDGRWMIGYLLDEDECDGEMIFSGYYANIDYVITAK